MLIDIAFSVNQGLVLPVLTAINSVWCHSHQPEALRFNIAVPPGEAEVFTAAVQQYLPRLPIRVREYLPPVYMQAYLDARFREQNPARRLSRYMQYSRLYLQEAFTDTDQVIYLDGDTLVLGDIAELAAVGEQLSRDHYVAFAPHNFPAIFYFNNLFSPMVWREARQIRQTFNSGVMLTRFSYWTDHIYGTIKDYLDRDRQCDYRFLNLGDEGLMNIVFRDCYVPLDRAWNRCGYGNHPWLVYVLKKPLAQTRIIHWSGGFGKPWESPRVTYAHLWQRYNPANE